MATPTCKTPLGGYDYQFVATSNELLHCSICMLVPRNVHWSKCCKKSFCKGCLEQLKQFQVSNPTCPNCRSTTGIRKCKEDRTADREIQSLTVYCNHRKGGCEWIGPVSDIDSHLSSCTYQLVECPNTCKEPLYPHQLEEHVKNKCPHRLVTCIYCQLTDIHKIITGSVHLNICPELPIDCPNKDCQETIVQKQLQNHREECPKEIIPCPYSSIIDCQELFKREDLQQHENEYMKQHLTVSIHKIDQLIKTSTALDSTVHQRKVLQLNNYLFHKEQKKVWYSQPFYTSQGGYKMCLSVFCNGNGYATNNYVSCFVHLLSGDYDDHLDWPFIGEVTVELLNQLQDDHHEHEVFKFSTTTPLEYRQRVRGKTERGRGGGLLQYVPHSQLGLTPAINRQFLKDDTLYFRVSAKVVSKTKPWLIV